MKIPKPKPAPEDDERQEAAATKATARKYVRNPFAPKKAKKGC